MMEFTNQQLIVQAREEVAFWRERDELIPSQQTAIRLRLAEIAMAALMTPKQEPVADVVAWSSPSEEKTCDIRWRRHDVKPGPLYTAPPAPVSVPDADPRDAFEKAFPIPKHVIRCGNGYACTEYNAWDAQGFIKKWDGWNACRAAMLQGAEPMQGWIPCSERMPEEVGRYWCYVEEQNSLGKSHYQWNCSWNGDRWWVESENGGRVTHWMTLPSAPQQEVK